MRRVTILWSASLQRLLRATLPLVELRARTEPLLHVGNVVLGPKNIGAFRVKELYETPEMNGPRLEYRPANRVVVSGSVVSRMPQVVCGAHEHVDLGVDVP